MPHPRDIVGPRQLRPAPVPSGVLLAQAWTAESLPTGRQAAHQVVVKAREDGAWRLEAHQVRAGGREQVRAT